MVITLRLMYYLYTICILIKVEMNILVTYTVSKKGKMFLLVSNKMYNRHYCNKNCSPTIILILTQTVEYTLLMFYIIN